MTVELSEKDIQLIKDALERLRPAHIASALAANQRIDQVLAQLKGGEGE